MANKDKHEHGDKRCYICEDGGALNEIFREAASGRHQLIAVMSDPPFTYTIGVHQKHGFEIIVFGLPAHYAGTILNDTVAKVKQGTLTIEPGVLVDVLANMPVIFRVCNEQKVSEYVVQAFRFHSGPVKVLQLVIPDRNGKFPEDRDYDHRYMDPMQPVLYDIVH